MNSAILEEIKLHAQECYPKECCGLICIVKGREKYFKCRNLAVLDWDFIIHPEDYAKAEDAGEIVTIVHSHCNRPATPTQCDLVSCEKFGKPWMIISWPTGQTYEFSPSGYKADLIGRQYHHGVLDCYTVCKDYYKEVLNIDLPDPVRQDEWWLKGENLYLENFQEIGFIKVDPLNMKLHDGILMQLASPVANHAAVYIGDNKILHHVANRLSSRDIYGGWFRKCTVAVIRHKSLI